MRALVMRRRAPSRVCSGADGVFWALLCARSELFTLRPAFLVSPDHAVSAALNTLENAEELPAVQGVSHATVKVRTLSCKPRRNAEQAIASDVATYHVALPASLYPSFSARRSLAAHVHPRRRL